MLPLHFTHEAHPARVVFGDGCRRRLAEEVDRLGLRRLLVIASPRLGAEIAAILGARAAVAIGGGVMHVPAEIAASASATATEAGADGIVAVGGGSAIGLAKAVARDRGLPDGGLPILAVPTTYAGSEMTSIWGQTEAGEKRTGRDERVRPKTVLYDPELTDALPAALAAQSGLNAVAHAMEALYTPKLDPVIALLAEEAVAALARALPLVVTGGPASDRAGHRDALYGAWLAGVCLDRATMGVHHKLAHVLGGSFGLPHAAVHAVILPYAAAFNREAAPEAMRRLARALGAGIPEAPAALFALGRRLGVPASLAAIGMRHEDLDRAADLATQSPYENPRPVDRAGVRALLEDAFAGRDPQL
jgi:alcohol dehydrogenase class IV